MTVPDLNVTIAEMSKDDLRQIIREEIEKALKEREPVSPQPIPYYIPIPYHLEPWPPVYPYPCQPTFTTGTK